MSEPKRRVPKPISQKEFCWLLSVSRQTVSRWISEGMPVSYVPWSKTPHYCLQDIVVWLVATDRIKFVDLLKEEIE